MNAPATIMSFASAYRQLTPHEKAYVDGFIRDVERDAQRRGERISLALHRVIPSDVVAASRGLLERPLVCAAIAERINDLAAATELTAHRLVKELMAIGFASFGDYGWIAEDGQPWFDLAKCTPEQLSAIKSIEIEESGRGRKFKFVLHDKLAALDKLARYMGLLEADNPHWRSDNARPIAQAQLAASTTTEAASDMWARMIND